MGVGEKRAGGNYVNERSEQQSSALFISKKLPYLLVGWLEKT